MYLRAFGWTSCSLMLMFFFGLWITLEQHSVLQLSDLHNVWFKVHGYLVWCGPIKPLVWSVLTGVNIPLKLGCELNKWTLVCQKLQGSVPVPWFSSTFLWRANYTEEYFLIWLLLEPHVILAAQSVTKKADKQWTNRGNSFFGNGSLSMFLAGISDLNG